MYVLFCSNNLIFYTNEFAKRELDNKFGKYIPNKKSAFEIMGMHATKNCRYPLGENLNEQQECSIKLTSLQPHLIVKISFRYPWKRFQVEKKKRKT